MIPCFSVSNSISLLESGLEEIESSFVGRESDGICGIAGTIGATFEADRGAPLDTGSRGGMAEDGVVGWVESASDGACDVAGVSDVATSRFVRGTEDVGELVMGPDCGSIAVSISSLGSDDLASALSGSSTGRLEDCGGGFRFLRLDGVIGNSDSGTEYQGS